MNYIKYNSKTNLTLTNFNETHPEKSTSDNSLRMTNLIHNVICYRKQSRKLSNLHTHKILAEVWMDPKLSLMTMSVIGLYIISLLL